ncbi:MAG: putative lipid II flippase FtsW [Anaerovoracaceae bacterium]|jgi:cell division protein FtsW|nr:putative lipid II flippase FtsW [Anaerovoracaceae bacterium]
MAKTKVRRTKMRSADFMMIMLTLMLVIFGIIMVFSASYYWSINQFGQPYHFLIRDLFWAVTGFGWMFAAMIIDYHVLANKKIAVGAMIVSIILLALVLTPLGQNINGATRWIGVGPITIMPGEVAKICSIIFVSWYLSEKPERVLSLTRGVIPMLLLGGAYAGLIMMQPNMSTAITVLFIIMMIMFVAGMKYKHLIFLFGLGGVAMCALIFTDEDGYRLKRVTSFLDPFKDALGDGYQVVQSLLALGSGGLAGLGLGKSIQKNLYLPEPQNDFILAIIGEELGYIAIILLLIVYMFMIWGGIRIAMNAPDRFGMLLASGVTAMIGIQVLLNVAVVTSSMPATGVTLPFISYGGNALWMFMFSMGILLNVSRHRKIAVPEQNIN